MGARAKHVVRELAHGRRKMLAVVDDEQQLLGAEVVEEPVESGNIRPFGDPEHSRDRSRHLPIVLVRRHLDQPDAAGPGADLPRSHLERQPRLARAAYPGQRDETVLSKQLAELRELLFATDEAVQLRWEVVPLLGGRRASDLVAQNRALERLQLLARLEPELLGKERSGPPVRGECIGLALAAVQGRDQLTPEALAERFLCDEALELGDERVVAAERELSLGALFDADKAKLVEASGLEREHPAVADVGERRATPQRECGAEAVRGEPGGAAASASRPSRRSLSNRRASTLSSATLEDVPRRPRDERVLAERRTQPRDIYAQRPFGAWRWGARPELVDQSVG